MRMTLRSAFVLAAGLGLAGVAFAQAKVIPAQSEIDFVIKEQGVAVDGKFAKWSADIAFDPRKPETGKVAFTIDTASATFGTPELDGELPKPTWFNVARFPTATFASSTIQAKGSGKFEVVGKLSAKGTTKDVTVPVTLAQSGGVTTATGQFAIKRNDFKIGEGEWAATTDLANDVLVKFKIALSGVGPL